MVRATALDGRRRCSPSTRVSCYIVTAVPPDVPEVDAYDYELAVEYRGRGLWGVYLGKVWCLSSSGTWDHEMLPSNFTDAWLRRHRFEHDDALRRAREAAYGIVVNGRTIGQLIEYERARNE